MVVPGTMRWGKNSLRNRPKQLVARVYRVIESKPRKVKSPPSARVKPRLVNTPAPRRSSKNTKVRPKTARVNRKKISRTEKGLADEIISSDMRMPIKHHQGDKLKLWAQGEYHPQEPLTL